MATCATRVRVSATATSQIAEKSALESVAGGGCEGAAAHNKLLSSTVYTGEPGPGRAGGGGLIMAKQDVHNQIHACPHLP